MTQEFRYFASPWEQSSEKSVLLRDRCRAAITGFGSKAFVTKAKGIGAGPGT